MKIFPKEIIDDTTEVFKFRHTVSSKIIYSIILITIIAFLVALPFIKVDVYTSAAGLVKPNLERVPVSVISSGQVKYSQIQDNLEVKEGDTILIIDNKTIDKRLQLSNKQSEEVAMYIKDLSYLTSSNNPSIKHLQSEKYRASFLEFKQKSRELHSRLMQKQSSFERNKALYENGVIALAEFEKINSEYEIALGEVSSFQKQGKNSWQTELINYQDALDELRGTKNQLLDDKSRFYVTAPVSGTIMNSEQLRPGSFIYQGIQVAEISPTTDLIAECYISPTDIGLINPNNRVIFQIDAYNYNQWGLANGTIEEISRDIVMMDQQPVFEVKCKIQEKYLELKNGVKGEIKKGMTVNARFLLTERSLYDLLYDNVNDWLNPATA